MASSISIGEFCESVYCAYVSADALTVDADEHIAFDASVTDGGRTSVHQVAFEGVRDFSLRRNHPSESEPGDGMELSVIEVEHEPGGWGVWLNPWYVEEVEFHCTAITLDGRVVTGEGRWLQDEPPRRSAGQPGAIPTGEQW